jgi:D-alanine-D-alanine ligase-like ATP-grasp enzyme
MTATSLLPQQARAAGLSFTALLEEILARAIRPATRGGAG